MNRKTIRTPSWLGLAILIPGALVHADIKVSSAIFDRGTYFRDIGNVKPMGRVFQNVPLSDMPPYGGPIEVRDASGILVAAVVDNQIFLSSTYSQNQTSFPGSLKFTTNSGTTIASFDATGKMYVKNVVEHVTSCVAPVWEGSKWDNYETILDNDNCYNYGNNQPTYTFAQPGRATGAEAASMSVSAVRTVALNDGLTWVGWNFPGNSYTCPGGGTLVFMTVDPGDDYHWYRLDKADGKWTHKPGPTPATDRDASGNLISNPLTANRNYPDFGLNYTDNGGFYCTCGGNAFIR